MDRYSPFQRAFVAFLAVFLLLLLFFWLSVWEELGLLQLAWLALKPSLLIGAVVWIAASISDLRYQVAALRSELERLKNKE